MDMPTSDLRQITDSITCDWQACLDCRAVWEPFPPTYARDPVCAEPCDNCAFRFGSPEQKDTEGWNYLIEILRSGVGMPFLINISFDAILSKALLDASAPEPV